MRRTIDVERLDRIREILLSIAEGDFSYQIERSKEDDDIESLVVLVNWITEEMNETLQWYSAFNARETKNNYIQILFVLDYNFNILNINDEASTQLGKPSNEIIGSSFSNFLNPTSKEKWKTISSKLLYEPDYTDKHKFQFVCGSQLTRKFLCFVTSVFSPVHDHPFILITSCQAIQQNRLIEDETKIRKLQAISEGSLPSRKPLMLLTEKDVKMIQEIRDYILKNLEKPLPSIKELANQFGTNEFKMKKGFNQLFGISIFRFLTEERLKRGSLFLQNTGLPISKISTLTGFKNTAHFATAFKKRYSISPKAYRKLFYGSTN